MIGLVNVITLVWKCMRESIAPMKLAVLIRDHLKEKGLMASLQPEFSKKME